MLYLICVQCQKSKEKMIVYHGNSYCIDCYPAIRGRPYSSEYQEDKTLSGLFDQA